MNQERLREHGREIDAEAEFDYRRTRKKIMVIDDCPKMTNFIRCSLKDVGNIDMVIFNNEFQAMNSFKRESPDLVLMDIHLKSLNGLRVRDLLENHSIFKIPFVVISYDEKYLSIVKQGGNEEELFLKKPFGRKELKTCLTRAFLQNKLPIVF
jgi:DNA-binding NtrC family response regulator